MNNNTSNDEYKIGLEYAFKDLLYLRGAYSMDPQEKTANYLYGPSFGVGTHFIVGIDIKAEYAYRWTQYFDANQVISVTLGF